MYVCICHAVTDKQIREAISDGAHSLRDLRRQLGVMSGCGKCGNCVRDILQQCQQATPNPDRRPQMKWLGRRDLPATEFDAHLSPS